METYLNTAVEIAREAGALLAQLFDHPREISYKRPSDLVTDADRRSEALIVDRERRHVKLGLLHAWGAGPERLEDFPRAASRGGQERETVSNGGIQPEGLARDPGARRSEL